MVAGFADITGYTARSLSTNPRDVAAEINQFEELVADATAAGGGRLIKLVGDGAMFALDDAVAACAVAQAIIAWTGAAGPTPQFAPNWPPAG